MMIETKTEPKLKQLREQRGITSSQLADALGVTQGCVSHWESGSRKPGFRNLVKLSNYFGVPVNGLFCGFDMSDDNNQSAE